MSALCSGLVEDPCSRASRLPRPGGWARARQNRPVLTIASVNVNGIRAAYRRGMGEWLDQRRPDVVALQEVRAGDDHLADHLGPAWRVAHAACDTPGRAGVAVATRLPVLGVRVGLGRSSPLASGRWIEVDVEGPDGAPLTIASVYVHKGEAGTPRMAEKYAFLDDVTARLGEMAAAGASAVVAGDLNIAHTERDLKNWRGNLRHPGFLPEERAFLDRWVELGWVDVARRIAAEGPAPYTWWSWRGKAFDADAGWRIDYQWATAPLASRALAAQVDRAASYAQRFSDHAPLVITYDL